MMKLQIRLALRLLLLNRFFSILVICMNLQGDPFQPVPAYKGMIVEGGHMGIEAFDDGSAFIAAAGLLAKADALVTAGRNNPQDTLMNCSRSCARASECNSFIFCSPGGGRCSGTPSGDLPELGCELIVQAESNSNRTLPFMASVLPTSNYIVSGKNGS